MRFLTPLLILLFASCVRAQSAYTLYLTGSATDVVTAPRGGVCMMGGRTENDEAMRWFLRRAEGGDVVVLRASGSDGYNDYFYGQLGVSVNSVRTFVFDSGADAGAVEVIEAVANAEAVWFAGGDQAKYVDYWRGTPLDSTLREVINERNAVVGGTSAGMAILGGHYFSAANGTVSSEEALTDPFNDRMTVESATFLAVPGLENVITDSHFGERDRQGRLLAFVARASMAPDRTLRAIACDEYTAVCIDTTGTARVFGDPDEDDYAYFVRPRCYNDAFQEPEQFAPGTPLSWGEENNVVIVARRLKGDNQGSATIDLNRNEWGTGHWEEWWATNGSFNVNVLADAPDCISNGTYDTPEINTEISPNPAPESLAVTTDWTVASATIVDGLGRTVRTINLVNARDFRISTIGLSPGGYYLLLEGGGKRAKRRFVVP